jgi:molybdopterin converting factor small subunit
MNGLALGWNMKIQVPVRIPAPLRKLTQNQEIVHIEGATIRDVINNLEQNYPGLKERICDERNNIRSAKEWYSVTLGQGLRQMRQKIGLHPRLQRPVTIIEEGAASEIVS